LRYYYLRNASINGPFESRLTLSATGCRYWAFGAVTYFTGLAMTSICTITTRTSRTVALRLIAIWTKRIITWITFAKCCSKSRFACFAVGRISHTVDTVRVLTSRNHNSKKTSLNDKKFKDEPTNHKIIFLYQKLKGRLLNCVW